MNKKERNLMETNIRHLLHESTLHVSSIVYQYVDPAIVDFQSFGNLEIDFCLRRGDIEV